MYAASYEITPRKAILFHPSVELAIDRAGMEIRN